MQNQTKKPQRFSEGILIISSGSRSTENLLYSREGLAWAKHCSWFSSHNEGFFFKTAQWYQPTSKSFLTPRPRVSVMAAATLHLISPTSLAWQWPDLGLLWLWQNDWELSNGALFPKAPVILFVLWLSSMYSMISMAIFCVDYDIYDFLLCRLWYMKEANIERNHPSIIREPEANISTFKSRGTHTPRGSRFDRA